MSSVPAFDFKAKIGNAIIAGVVGVTCTFPVDLCKTRLQNTVVGPNGERMYKGIFDCFMKTLRAEGLFRGLYSGWAVNTLLIAPEKCIKLALNDYLRHQFGEKNGNLRWYGAMGAGAMAGGCQVIVTTPMELLKIQRQDAGRSGATLGADGKAIQKTAWQVSKELYAERGFLGLYKGFRPTFLRDVVFSAVYFPLVAVLNKEFLKVMGYKETDRVFGLSFTAAFISGSVASITVNPFDVVKTRLQTLQKGKGETSYNGIRDCFVKVYRNEGMKAFFKGGQSRVIAIAMLFGIAQSVYWVHAFEYIFYEKAGFH